MNRVSVTTGVFCGVLVCAMSAWAGPEQDFDAAVKAGRPLSAESAYRALVKSGAKTSPLRHYLAADIAEGPTRENIEEIARDELGLVTPNEYVFDDVSK